MKKKKKDYLEYRKRSLLMIAVDALTVALVFCISYYVCRFTVLPTFQHLNSFSFLMHLLFIIVTYMPVMLAFGTYRSIWRVAQAKEYFICCIASVSAGFVYFIFSRAFFRGYSLPFYFYFLVMCAVPLGLITLRLFYRILRTSAGHGQHLPYTYRRAVIVGTGRRAMSLVSDIENTPYCLIRPFAAVGESADTPSPHRLLSIPVKGALCDIVEICHDGGADLIITASDTLTPSDIIRTAADACCEITVCPDGKLTSLAPPTVADFTGGVLLGDSEECSDTVNGKRVLMLGVSRAFARPLAKRLASLSPSHIAFADSDASSLVTLREMLGDATGCVVEYRLCDTSKSHLDALFADVKPDITIAVLPTRAPYGIDRVGDDDNDNDNDNDHDHGNRLSAAAQAAEKAGCTVFLSIVPDNGGTDGGAIGAVGGADTDTKTDDNNTDGIYEKTPPMSGSDASAMRRGRLLLLPATDEVGGVFDCAMRDIRAGKTVCLPFSGDFAAVCAEDEARLVLEALECVASDTCTSNCDGYDILLRVLPGIRVNPETLLPLMARASGLTLHGVCVPEAVSPRHEISPDGLPRLVRITDRPVH